MDDLDNHLDDDLDVLSEQVGDDPEEWLKDGLDNKQSML